MWAGAVNCRSGFGEREKEKSDEDLEEGRNWGWQWGRCWDRDSRGVRLGNWDEKPEE